MSASEAGRLLDPEGGAEADKKEKKRLKKLQKAKDEAHQPLDGWQRYRALTDAFEMEQDMVDLADNKARFALLIMNTMNAVTFVLCTRSEALAVVPASVRPWLGFYVGGYALIALYFSMQAIESLRPRKAKPNVHYPGEAGLQDYPMGIRFYEDVLARDISAYKEAWRNVRLGQLNAEIALQVQLLARINSAKYKALGKLYLGLRLMTLLTAFLMSGFASLALAQSSDAAPLVGQRRGSKAAAKPQKAKHPAALLGQPSRFTDIGAREPSGVAYHPRLGHLFVVGDEGSLVELDENAKLIKTHPVKGNLEDLAVHTPSGNLLLLSEKKSQLILYDPVSEQDLRRWKMNRVDLLGQEPGDRNAGFEGLAFREDATRYGGGIFYLVHQRMPEMVVGVAIDLAAPSGPLKAEVVSRFTLTEKNTKAAAYVPSLERLLVLSAKKGLTVLRMDGTVEAEIPIGGDQPEGMCLDGAGNLWIAEDRGKALLRFGGALQALTDHLREEPGPSPAPRS